LTDGNIIDIKTYEDMMMIAEATIITIELIMAATSSVAMMLPIAVPEKLSKVQLAIGKPKGQKTDARIL